MNFIEEIFKNTDDYIEIREIDKEGKVSRHFFSKQEMKTYNPPKGKNVYFGGFSRLRRSGRAKDCNTTRVLWVDYDERMEGLTVAERATRVRQKVRAVGLPEPSILVSSGNGIHSYWLLNKREAAGIVEVNKAIAKATNGDIQATDKARIMRLPCTMNLKDKSRPLTCMILQADYSLIYDLRDINTVLRDYIGKVKMKSTNANLGVAGTVFNNVRPDRPCIATMLKGVEEGKRNFAQGRLTKWLQIKGNTKKQSRNIIIEWNKRNNPPEQERKLLNDFNQYWKGDYLLLGCSHKNPELQQKLYKYCNRPECKFTMSLSTINLQNSIPYNNRLLNDLYKLTGNDLIIYGVLTRHKKRLTTSLLVEKLTSSKSNRPCMSKPTRIKSLETLRKKGFIEVVEGVQSKGKEHSYRIIPQGNFGLGYTLLNDEALKRAIDREVTPPQLRLYVLLLKYAFRKGSCYPSLSTLAKELRNSSSNISKLLKGLEKNDYIRREKVYINGIESLDIRPLI